jgi:Cof subfamily protein (haloacid dehalogenase superfamily)
VPPSARTRAPGQLASEARTGRTAGGARSGAPRLIATDLDGTFLRSDGRVSEINSAAVLAAQQAGIPVLFATGRPVRWLDVIRDLPGAHPTVIASNGAVLYDLGAGQLLDRICLSASAALTAVRDIRAAVPGSFFGFESGTRFGYEPAYSTWADDDGDDPAIYRGPAEEIAAEGDFVKLLVQHPEVAADQLLDLVREVVAGTLTATHSASRGYGLVELSALGVSKASMLRRCCARLGVAATDVAAFGDMPNDLDMLSWVGLPRVVTNAHPRLLASGFEVVPSNDESGVGQTILAWLS